MTKIYIYMMQIHKINIKVSEKLSDNGTGILNILIVIFERKINLFKDA